MNIRFFIRAAAGNIAFFLVLSVFSGCASAPKGPPPDTYYVRADGSDQNDGLSEETPFRSLFKAMAEASRTDIKTITLLSSLDLSSEQSSNSERVFIIQGTGKDLITIRGRDGEKTVLSGAGAGRRVILVKGISYICFENLEISGGSSAGEGGGLGVGVGSQVILGKGITITGNRSETAGGGIAVASGGKLYIRGASVSGNSASGVGGGVAVSGADTVLVMEGGEIRENSAEGGGGVAVYEGGVFTLKDGAVSGNRAAIAGGGIVLNRGAALTMEGGSITGNSSAGLGGALALIDNCAFTLLNGDIANNTSGEYGGGVAADHTATLVLRGGNLRGNSAVLRGGGFFSSGAFFKAPESLCVIYGNDAPEGSANSAQLGSAVYVSRDGYGDMIRERSAGAGTLLDSGRADGGWQNAGFSDAESGLNTEAEPLTETGLSVDAEPDAETGPEPAWDAGAFGNTDGNETTNDEFSEDQFSQDQFSQEAVDELSE
ncbi:MAG: autotransporter adhesin family protein [Treponema sp.]|jgi:hypothetical protein|nr:autotransporter adhesin family protein [Treponema sp.]